MQKGKRGFFREGAQPYRLMCHRQSVIGMAHRRIKSLLSTARPAVGVRLMLSYSHRAVVLFPEFRTQSSKFRTGRPRSITRPRFPQTRTCAINAFGFSSYSFATPRSIGESDGRSFLHHNRFTAVTRQRAVHGEHETESIERLPRLCRSSPRYFPSRPIFFNADAAVDRTSWSSSLNAVCSSGTAFLAASPISPSAYAASDRIGLSRSLIALRNSGVLAVEGASSMIF